MKKDKMLSIFDIKLKTPIKIVKDSKIKKIMNSLYNKTDHTNKLETTLKSFYDKHGGYVEFLKDEESFINKIKTQNNFRNDLDFSKKENKLLLLKSFSLNAGDIIPNTEEIEEICDFLITKDPQITENILINKKDLKNKLGIIQGDEFEIFKKVISNLYSDIDGRFPNEKDLNLYLESLCLINEEFTKEMIQTSEYKFRTISERVCLKVIEDVAKGLRTDFRLFTIPANMMFFIRRFPRSNNKLNDLIKSVESSEFLSVDFKNDGSLDILPSVNKMRIDCRDYEREKFKKTILTSLEKNNFSNNFIQIIKSCFANELLNTISFAESDKKTQLLFSNNYKEEMVRFIKLSKRDYSAKVYKGSHFYGEQAIHITFFLEHDIEYSTLADLESLIK